MTTHTINVPIPFGGTKEEGEANFASHHWANLGDFEEMEYRCLDCDSKPWHQAARYPCGTNPPRMDVGIEGDTVEDAMRKLLPR